ncbi:MAG: ABC transporter ATP-binding protein [Pseudonocardia sp.]
MSAGACPGAGMRLELRGVSVALDGITITAGCDLRVDTGEMVALVGPNGSGKSTLLRSVYRVLRPSAGTVHLGAGADPEDAWALLAAELARRCAVVTQEAPEEFDFSVEEVVLMGRSPHKRGFQTDGAHDRELAGRALDQVGLGALGGRTFATLSGGERQRVLVARALAQQAPVLLLDEPTNHLDLRSTLGLLDLVRAVGLTTLCVLHDLNLAAAYCDRVYVLAAGRIVADGPPHDVLTPALVRDVFGVDACRVRHPGTGRLQLMFTPLTGDPGPQRAVTEPAPAAAAQGAGTDACRRP